MNEIIIKNNKKIEDFIYEVRGKQIILANDVAKLYHVETKRINEIVKRNINRFPSEFCFQLTKEEYELLRSQFATSIDNYYDKGGNRYLPYAFTEHGIMMISGLLKSEIAVRVNVAIIKAFVSMKKYISNKYNMILAHIFSMCYTFSHDISPFMLNIGPEQPIL